MKKTIFCMLALSVYFLAMSQDTYFLNTNQSLVYLNPSFVGSNGLIRSQNVINDNRNLDRTGFSSIDGYIKQINGGLGFTYYHHDLSQGVVKTDRISLIYAQHISLLEGRLKIIPSVQLTYFEKELDRSKLIFGEHYPTHIISHWGIGWGGKTVRKRNADISTGLLMNYKKIYFGVTAFHITQPDEGLMGSSRLPIRLAVNTSYNWQISGKTLIHFFNRFEYQGAQYFYQATASALLFSHFIIGAGFIHATYQYATINLGYRNRYYTIQGSYGIAANDLNHKNFLELSAGINLRNKDQRNLVTDFETW